MRTLLGRRARQNTRLRISQLAILLSLAVACAWTTAAAQQPPAAEKAKQTDRREQRRQRFRELSGQIADTLRQVQPAGGQQFDLGRINAGLTRLAALLTAGDTSIESLSIGLDAEQTDLANDRVGVAATASLRRSAWSDKSTDAKLSLAARIESSDGAGPQAMIDGNLLLDTDVLALANHVLKQYKERAEPKAAVDPTDADAVFQQRLYEKLQTVAPLTSLDDLADLVLSIGAVRLSSASENVDQLAAKVAATTDPNQRAELTAKLTDARKSRDALLGTRPGIERSADGRATQVTLTMDDFPVSERLVLDHVVVTATAEKAEIALSTGMTQGVGAYMLAKPLVFSALQQLESGDPQALEGLRMMLSVPWAGVRGAVTGEEVEGELVPPPAARPSPAPPKK